MYPLSLRFQEHVEEGVLTLARNWPSTVGFGNIAGKIRVPSYRASGACHP